MVVWDVGLSVSSFRVKEAAVGTAKTSTAAKAPLESLSEALKLFIGTSWYQIRLF